MADGEFKLEGRKLEFQVPSFLQADIMLLQRIYSLRIPSRTILASRTKFWKQKSKKIANPFSVKINFKAMATSEARKHKPYSFCHYCGSQYGMEMAAFPKKCGSCNNKM